MSHGLIRATREFDKLTVAAINGPAIQSGLSLALGCDFRVASTTATLGSASLRFGILPDEGGHHLLVEHLDVARTLGFLLRNRIVDAATARELGLVTEIADPVVPHALDLATGPQVAMRLLKRAVWNAGESTMTRSLDDIAARAAVSDHHPGAVEGVTAFRERRPPRFS